MTKILTSGPEVSMQLTCCIAIGGVSFLWCLVKAKMVMGVIDANLRQPFLSPSVPGHAFKSVLVGPGKLLILSVLLKCCFAKIINPIVCRVMVDMINDATRPLPVSDEPRQPVAAVHDPLEADTQIPLAVSMLRDHACVSAVPMVGHVDGGATFCRLKMRQRPYFPCKRSSLWIVVKAFTDIFRSWERLFRGHHESSLSHNEMHHKNFRAAGVR